MTSAMDRLSLDPTSAQAAAIETRLVEEENGTCDNVRPRKKSHQDTQELLAELENEFLTPSPRFSTKWLNQLQK